MPLFCRSLTEAPVAGHFLKILLTPILGAFFFLLFWAVVLIEERIDSRDYWRHQGAYDFWRIPLEYPYELRMIDHILMGHGLALSLTQMGSSAKMFQMSSAKLQVRPILLKKISFLIFFNNYLSDYETRRGEPSKRKNQRTTFSFLSRPN